MWNDMFDFYKLRQTIKNEISVFLFVGILISIYVVGILGYKFQTYLSLSSPGLEFWLFDGIPNAVSIAMLMIIAPLFIFILGLIGGAVLHALFLMLTKRLSLKQAFGATLLTKYPLSWYR